MAPARPGLLATLTAFSFVAGTFGQTTYTWTGQASGTWSTGTNWLGGSPPPGGGDPTGVFVFQGLGTPSTTALTSTNDLGATQFNVLRFQSQLTGAGGFTVTSATGNSLQSAGANAQIQQAGLGAVTFASAANLALNNNLRIGGVGGPTDLFGLGSMTFSGPIAVGGNTLTIGNGATGNAPTGNTRVVALNGQNAFAAGGGVTLDGGTISLGGTTTANSGLGAADNTFTVTSNGGRLQTSTTISSLATGSFQLNGELEYIGTSSLTLVNTLVNGAGPLTLRTTGTFTVQSASNAYSGAVTTDISRLPNQTGSAGTLTLSSSNGSMTGVSTFNVFAGGSLNLTNNVASSTVNSNRVSDTATINLRSGNLSLTGGVAGAGGATETVGAVNGAGYSTITATPGTGTSFTALTLSSLNRIERGTFLFRGTSLGSAGTGNVGNIIITSAPTGDLVGGGGGAGATNISILPYAVGDTSGTGSGTSLVTLDANGVRTLNTTTEYQANSFAGTDQNIRLTASTANAGSATINALVLGASGAVTGGGILNVTSGTILSAATSSVSNNLAFGAREANIFTTSGTLTISGNLTGAGGLTKSGTAALTLSGDNTGLTGGLTINGGIINVGAMTSLVGTGQIVVNGTGGGSTNAGVNYTGAGAANLARDVAINAGYFNVRSATSTAPLTVSGVISGVGGVFISTSGDVALTGNNTYTGPTRIFNGSVRISSDANLGAGGALDMGSTSTAGVVLDGNWTTSRHINYSFGTLLNTQANNAVWNGVVTGSAGMFKAGSGSLRINSANPFSGAVTVNANGGEIRLAQNGTLLSTSYTVNTSGNLFLDNTALPANAAGSGNVLTDRVADTSTLTLVSGGALRLLGNASASVTERLGNVTLTGGNNIIQVDAVGGQTASLSIFNLNTANGTVLVRGTNLGESGFAGRVFLTNFNSAAATNGQILGNVTAENLNNLGVVEQAVYDTTVGIRLATASDFFEGAAIQNAPPTNTPTTANFRVSPAVANPVVVLDAANTINSLRFAPNGVLNYNGGVDSTLTITSGSVFTEAGGSGASITNTGTGLLTLTAGSTPWNFGVNANLQIQAAIAGTGGLNKNGSGELQLHAANTFTGPLNVNAGTLRMAGSSSLANGLATTISSGTTLILNNSPYTFSTLNGAGALQLGDENLTITASSTFSGVVSGNGGLTFTGGTLTLSGANTFTGGLTTGASSALSLGHLTALGTGPLTLGNTSSQTVTFNTGSGTVANNIQLSAPAAAIITTFTNGSNATQSVTLSGVVSGGNANQTLRFTGSSADTSTFVLANAGNTFTGTVSVFEGVLAVASNGALGNAANTVSLNTTTTTATGGMRFDAHFTGGNVLARNLNFIDTNALNTNGFDVEVSGVVANSGGLLKTGTGTLTLSSNANTHTGAIGVNAGRLLINGNVATGTNAVAVASGATLGGTGIINRPVTINSGGTLSPGASIGTLTVGNTVTLNGNGTTGGWDIELNAVPTNTPASAAGSPDVDILALTGASSNLNIVSSSSNPLRVNVMALTTNFDLQGPVNYVIATADAGSNFLWNGGAFTFDPTAYIFRPLNFSADSFALSVDGNRLLLSFNPVPEPGTWAMIGLAAAAAWGWRHRSKRGAR